MDINIKELRDLAESDRIPNPDRTAGPIHKFKKHGQTWYTFEVRDNSGSSIRIMRFMDTDKDYIFKMRFLNTTKEKK
jgi:hypothetical protein